MIFWSNALFPPGAMFLPFAARAADGAHCETVPMTGLGIRDQNTGQFFLISTVERGRTPTSFHVKGKLALAGYVDVFHVRTNRDQPFQEYVHRARKHSETRSSNLF